jgi:hypothetical protein
MDERPIEFRNAFECPSRTTNASSQGQRRLSAAVKTMHAGLLTRAVYHTEVNVRVGSGIRAQRQPDSGLECAAEPTFAAVALLHLKRTAAIRAVEGHLIE